MIDYDARRSSLYTPALRPTLFSSPTATITPWVCAEISRLVYAPFERDSAQLQRLSAELETGGFALLHTFNDTDTSTQAIAVRHSGTGQLVIAFRGTEQDGADYATLAQVWQVKWQENARVHTGFCKAFNAIWPKITTALDTPALSVAIFTGHSLGGALAHLAVSHLQSSLAQLITIGSPAVGNDAFVASLSMLTPQRYVNCCDLVTRLPKDWLGFAPAGAAHYIDRAGQLHPPQSPLSARAIEQDQAQARSDYTSTYFLQPGTVKLRDLADHAPINYVRALV